MWSNRPLLVESIPTFAVELTELLLASDQPELARQVSELSLIDRCRCGDSFCSTFYTEPPPRGSYGPKHRNVVLEPPKGMIVLDVIEQRIVCVEVLHREDVRTHLVAVCP